jgi:hypothetical protein
MNKYLQIKNEQYIKTNSTDFYILSLYSKEILGKDILRINKYRNFKNENSQKSILNALAHIFISSLLIYKFKSLLIIPIFYTNYYILDNLFKTDICYFCNNNQNTKDYEDYYNLIKTVFERNKNIKCITDFEYELDRIINENKYI